MVNLLFSQALPGGRIEPLFLRHTETTQQRKLAPKTVVNAQNVAKFSSTSQ
jgi:hypothetical protein